LSARLLAALAAATLAALPAAAEQAPVRIGFVSTFSGPAAEIGAHMRNAFELALDDLGHHMGGRPVEVIYEDDRQQPETGAQQTRKLIEADHVDILTGYIWSNVLLASLKPALDAGVILVSAHAGPSQVAGELCSPLFFATGVQNDQTAAAVGLFMNQEGIGRAYLLSPNYAAGRDILAGFKTTFKGRVVRETYTRWPDHMDFSAEISAIRAAAPDAVFAFYPGAAGVQFLNQYAGAGLKDRIPLYTAFVIDEMTLPLQGENALGVPGAQEWVNDLPNEANRRFVAAYRAKYHLPPSYYDAEAYDAAQLIAGGLAAVGGDPRRREAMIAAMEKVPFAPVRGPFRFGNNHFPIQDFYLQTVQKRPDGTLGLATRATIVRGFQDAYHDRCPMK
jgi:branched-chain amino acid transport system substrate-binding protein